MKVLLKRTLTGIGLIVVIAGSILLGALPFLVLLILVYVLGTRELFALYPEPRPLKRLAVVIPGLVFLVLVTIGAILLIRRKRPTSS